MLLGSEMMFLKKLTLKYKVKKKKWVLAGTSNGGIAAFNLLNKAPKLFKKVYLMPGYIDDSVKVNKAWKRIKFVMAYGESDEQSWKDKVKSSSERLKKVQTFEMKGQGHIIKLDYDQNQIYKLL